MRIQTTLRFAFTTLVLLAATGCDDGGDARTEMITPGMDRAAVMSTLQGGEPGSATDPQAFIWRSAQYIVDGKMIEVVWYSRDNERRTATDTIPRGKVLPVVLADGVAVGAGYAVFDSVAAATKIPRTKY